MTDVELDARVTTLEENGGDGNSFNGKTNDFFNIFTIRNIVAAI